MSAKAAVRYSGNVAIVDLAGRITLGDGSGLIRNTFGRAAFAMLVMDDNPRPATELRLASRN
jgi:hypothetical protein